MHKKLILDTAIYSKLNRVIDIGFEILEILIFNHVFSFSSYCTLLGPLTLAITMVSCFHPF